MQAIVLTGRTAGAIAAILVRGARAWRAISTLTGRDIVGAVGTVRRSTFKYDGQVIDDGLVVPTGADTVELHIHGGLAVIDTMLAALRDLGAQIVDPAEARHVFGDSLETQVQLALPRALTPTAVRLLANQTGPGLHAWLQRWRAHLDRGGSQIEFETAAQWLLDRSVTLRHLLEPARVAIIGPPNAGKSTLANALLGRPVSITSDTPGTTRDWVDATAIFVSRRGVQVPVVLVDTAGVREAADALEAESIRRTHEQLRQADAVIAVLDATRPDAAMQQLIESLTLPTVVAVNKCDLADARVDIAREVVKIAALPQRGLEDLMHAVLRQLDLADVHEDEPMILQRETS